MLFIFWMSGTHRVVYVDKKLGVLASRSTEVYGVKEALEALPHIQA